MQEITVFNSRLWRTLCQFRNLPLLAQLNVLKHGSAVSCSGRIFSERRNSGYDFGKTLKYEKGLLNCSVVHQLRRLNKCPLSKYAGLAVPPTRPKPKKNKLSGNEQKPTLNGWAFARVAPSPLVQLGMVAAVAKPNALRSSSIFIDESAADIPRLVKQALGL